MSPFLSKTQKQVNKRLTLDDMTNRGWQFSNQSTCEACGESVEWWSTPEGTKAKLVPMQRGSDPQMYHNSVCTGR